MALFTRALVLAHAVPPNRLSGGCRALLVRVEAQGTPYREIGELRAVALLA